MYYYYKGHEKVGKWWPIEEEALQERLSKDSDIGFTSVLSVSERAGPGSDLPDSVEYSGPFYMDFDSEDLKKSIKATQTAVNKLVSDGVPASYIQVWASGKKGFHVTVPMWAFTQERSLKRLPRIYLWLAKTLQMTPTNKGGAWDDTVYSCGKGRMWRVENRQRLDNQQFKVRVTPEELKGMTEERYAELCKAPRSLPATVNGSGAVVPALEKKWQIATICASKERQPKAVFVDPVVKEELGGSLPPCVSQLLAFENIREGKGFNDLSLQMAKGLAAFADYSEADELLTTFAKNAHGKDHYTTEGKRRDHCRIAYQRAQKSASYDWSCPSMLSVLASRPCATCKIREHVFPESVAVPQVAKAAEPSGPVKVSGFTFESQAAADMFLKAVRQPQKQARGSVSKPVPPVAEVPTPASAAPPGGDEPPPPPQPSGAPEGSDTPAGPDENYLEMQEGMGFLTKDGAFRRVSNFTFKITERIVEYIPAIQAERLVSLTVQTYLMGKSVGKAYLEEEAWLSKGRFMGSFLGLPGLAFYGKEEDIQRIRSAVMTGMGEDILTINRVYSHGIMHQRVGEQDVFTYVEPGWSVDSLGFENLCSISGKPEAAPELKLVEESFAGDKKTEDLLYRMTQINTDETVAQMLGWYMACFFKQHIFTFRNEFPLLNVNGQAGAGKTQTACLLGALHGVDFLLTDKPMTISTASEFPIWKYVESSMTVPRIFDEFNKSKMAKNYDKVSEVLKEVWNQHTISRGTIAGTKLHGPSRGGAHTLSIPLTGPTVLLSEQSIQMPALRERCIQVSLSKVQRKNQDMTEAFRECVDSRAHLRSFAKTAYMTMLHMSADVVRGWVDDNYAKLPAEIDDRPRYSCAVVLSGLQFLQFLCQRLNFIRLAPRIRELSTVLMKNYKTELVTEFLYQQKSEVDIVIEKMAIMAALTSSGTIPWLEKRRHYFKSEQTLLLDLSVCHAMYVRYMRSMEMSPAVIESPAELKKLLANEPYCISVDVAIPEFAKGRPVVQLSLAEMKKKGLDPDQFEGALA